MSSRLCGSRRHAAPTTRVVIAPSGATCSHGPLTTASNFSPSPPSVGPLRSLVVAKTARPPADHLPRAVVSALWLRGASIVTEWRWSHGDGDGEPASRAAPPPTAWARRPSADWKHRRSHHCPPHASSNRSKPPALRTVAVRATRVPAPRDSRFQRTCACVRLPTAAVPASHSGAQLDVRTVRAVRRRPNGALMTIHALR